VVGVSPDSVVEVSAVGEAEDISGEVGRYSVVEATEESSVVIDDFPVDGDVEGCADDSLVGYKVGVAGDVDTGVEAGKYSVVEAAEDSSVKTSVDKEESSVCGGSFVEDSSFDEVDSSVTCGCPSDVSVVWRESSMPSAISTSSFSSSTASAGLSAADIEASVVSLAITSS